MRKYRGLEQGPGLVVSEGDRPSAKWSAGYLLSHLVVVVCAVLVIYAVAAVLFGVLVPFGAYTDSTDEDEIWAVRYRYAGVGLGLIVSGLIAGYVSIKGWFFADRLRRSARGLE